MASQLASYLSRLFEPSDLTAAAHRLQDCRARTLTEVLEAKPQWVSVNPFKVWKLDTNVTSFRNIVVEFDKGLTVEEQLPFVADSGFPITTAVFSGNKSIHFVCSLSEPMASLEEFREVRRWIDIIFPGGDQSVKDPARFTRAPEGINEKTGRTQELVEIKQRVSPKHLATFLARHESRVAAHDESLARLRTHSNELRERGEMSASSWRFLRGEEGVRDGMSRHTRLYAIVCDLCDVVGMDYVEALAVASSCADAQGITAEFGREAEAEKIVSDVYFKRTKMRR